jgi:hypothetical protein
LRVEGRIDFTKYQGLDPLYTEYNIGHYSRAFTLSSKIDQQQISAELEDGVLKLTLKKAQEAMPRRIASADGPTPPRPTKASVGFGGRPAHRTGPRGECRAELVAA